MRVYQFRHLGISLEITFVNAADYMYFELKKCNKEYNQVRHQCAKTPLTRTLDSILTSMF